MGCRCRVLPPMREGSGIALMTKQGGAVGRRIHAFSFLEGGEGGVGGAARGKRKRAGT